MEGARPLVLTNCQVPHDTVPPRRVTPITAVEGLPEDSRNPRNSRRRQPSSLHQVRNLSLNFLLCVLCLWEVRLALSKPIVKLTKSVDLLKMKLCPPVPSLCQQFPWDQGWQTRLLPLVAAILHERIGNYLDSATCRKQEGYPSIVSLVLGMGPRYEEFPTKCHGRAVTSGCLTRTFNARPFVN